MILLSHIIIAMTSIVAATLLFFSPSDFKFKANYLLLGATLTSGAYLVISSGTHLVESCILGLVYLGAVSFALVSARIRFARQKDSTER